MIFVAKSSPERTRVPRRVTDRLTVRHLVNINPVNPRASPSSRKRMASSEPSRKRGKEEMTVMDYAFKVNSLAGNLEREVVPPRLLR
jgi:hypothetical protein